MSSIIFTVFCCLWNQGRDADARTRSEILSATWMAGQPLRCANIQFSLVTEGGIGGVPAYLLDIGRPVRQPTGCQTVGECPKALCVIHVPKPSASRPTQATLGLPITLIELLFNLQRTASKGLHILIYFWGGI
jgi:hypothetical protein